MKRKEFAIRLKWIVITSAVFIGTILFIALPFIADDFFANGDGSFVFAGIIVVWITAIPVFISLWHIWKICCEISADNSFCRDNSRRLSIISKLALLDTVIYILILAITVLLSVWTPLMFISAVFLIFVGLIISGGCTMLSHLVEKSAVIKEENDLTI